MREQVPLSRLVEINPRRVIPSGISPSSEVSFISMADVSETGEWVTRKTRPLSALLAGYTAFLEGDVLFAKITPCMENGKGAHARGLAHGLGFGSTEFHVLRARASADPRFIFHWVHSSALRMAAKSFMIGSAGQQRVSTKFFDAFRVPALPLAEQRRAGEILDTLHEAIRTTEDGIAKLTSAKQGLLHDLLTRGIDERGELRDPERRPHDFKDTPLGRVPKAWNVARFASYAAEERPYLRTGPFGSSLKQEHWVQEGVPVITIGSLGEGEFIESELLYVSDATAGALSSYAVLPGDIVFSRVADVGRSVVVRGAQRGWILSSNMMRIALDTKRADPAYVQANIASNSAVRRQIRRFVNSAGRDVANAAIMNSLLLPWAPVVEQKEIVRRLAVANARIQLEMSELEKVRLLKEGLMDDLLTGCVRTTTMEPPL